MISLSAIGARTKDFPERWKALDKLMAEQSYQSAYKEAGSALAAAKKAKLSTEQLVATWYLNRAAMAYQEEATDSAAARYEALLPSLAPADRAVGHSLLARLYSSYRDRYTLDEQERARLTAEHRAAALSDSELLKRTAVTPYEPLCNISGQKEKGLLLTPTLYDLLVREEMGMCNNEREQLPWLQRLIAFHADDSDENIRLYLDMELLDMQSSIPNGTKPTVKDWERLTEKYQGSQGRMMPRLYVRVARMLEEKGDYLRAVAYCERVATLFPKSDEAKECASLKERIERPRLSMDNLGVEMSERYNMTTVSYRNAGTLYFRIVGCTESEQREIRRSNPLGKKVLQRWSQEVERDESHQSRTAYCYLPPMPAGHYLLLASTSEDFGKNGYEAIAFDCCDATLLAAGSDRNSLYCGYAVDQKTGRPIANHEIRLEKTESNKTVMTASVKTDEKGWYKFVSMPTTEGGRWRSDFHIALDYQGYTLHHSTYLQSDRGGNRSGAQVQVLLDRPIYKPGEQVQFNCVLFKSDGWQEAATLAGIEVRIGLRDINYKEIDTLRLTTDAYGSVHGTLQLPAEGLPGYYAIDITARNGNETLRTQQTVAVEAYKQPTFAITLRSEENDLRFGKEAHLAGDAVSYSQVPINGATVTYTVERRQRYLWWRGYDWKRPGFSSESDIVASGETTTDAQGHFDIRFTPEPDSNVELNRQSVFIYTVRATVTDLNGETHEQSLVLNVGYVNGMLLITNGEEAESLTELAVQYLNLNGSPVAGEVRVEVDRLRQPAEPLLAHPHQSAGVAHSLSREDFAERFPNMAYDLGERDAARWEVEKRVFEGSVATTQEKLEQRVALPRLDDGVYRVSLNAIDDRGDTVHFERAITLTSPKARQCQSMELVWSHLGRPSAEVGEEVHLHAGSRYKDVTLFVAICDGNGGVERRLLTLDNEVKEIAIPVTKEMLGGLTVNLISVKEGVAISKSYTVDVPFSQKKMEVRLETLRDKLTPGSEERWTLRVKGSDGEPRRAATTLTMYDAALDNYASLSWRLWPWRGNSSRGSLFLTANNIGYTLDNQPQGRYYYSSFSPTLWQLNTTEIHRYHTRMYKMANAMPMSMGAVDYAVMEDALEESAVEVSLTEEIIEEDESADMEVGATEETESGDNPLRQNLNTLAFFFPHVESDAAGEAAITFTVPDLLTEWNVRALAYTTDLQAGERQQKVVTQKELMVMPMIPRFFRQGDRAVLSVKVSNITDQPQEAVVRIELCDAVSGRAWDNYKPQTIALPAKGSGVADFAVEVPRGSYAATYKITAESDRHRDGEQGVVAVLSNRQLVTESQAMYVNGAGEKSYALPQLAGSESREPRLLAVEFTSNPIWLAIQALPYVAERENPSNIYLFNKYFCTRVSRRIVSQYPNIENVFAQWQADTVNTLQSRLSQNSDLKQTLMEETPWLCAAENETQNMQQIGNYFDQRRIEREQQESLDKLVAAQRGDGGWSWMPEGDYSSEYTTRYLLRVMAALTEEERKPLQGELKHAMQYVDQQVAEHYEKYIKKEKVKEAMDVEYLYLHSCYPTLAVGSAAKEAYNYYLANAKRLALKQTGLYYRAQLALTMQRTGNKELARKLVKQLKECSLTSDEMGMYWRDNVSGFFYTDRPVEVQSFLIAAFEEVAPADRESVALMRQWLLKQKQTTSWNSDIASVSAITALLSDGKPLTEGTPATVRVGQTVVNSPAQAGTGYQSQRWQADQITPDMNSVSITQHNESIGWGAAYWQYVDDVEKIAASSMGIALEKSYLLVRGDGVTPLREGDRVQMGDRVRVQLLIACDRHLEYVELKEARPAGFEPVSSASGWRWSEGMSYYAAVTNTALHCYIDRLDKGKYVISYDLYATQAGTFSTGLSVMQSLYAPEFRALSPARSLTVAPRK